MKKKSFSIRKQPEKQEESFTTTTKAIYFSANPDIKNLGLKWLMFDSDAFIDLAKFNLVESILNDLKDAEIVPSIMHPVKIELLATKCEKDRRIIAPFLEDLSIITVTQNIIKYVDSIQKETYSLNNCSPSPVDLYCAAAIASLGLPGEIGLLTRNIKDYPSHLFDIKGTIAVDSKHQGYVVAQIFCPKIEIREILKI